VNFSVLIPARMASTRLPDKPLADLGGLPMVVRVAQVALQSGAQQVAVATDDARVQAACAAHGITALMTRADHPSGSDRLAEACDLLGLADDAVVVNLQGDEPLMPPEALRQAAELLHQRSDCDISTLAHPIEAVSEFTSPNVVKVVTDVRGTALYFSRAPIAWWRDGFAHGVDQLPAERPLRHIGLYAYRVGFLRRFPRLGVAPLERLESLEQLRALWHGHRIAVWVTPEAPMPGVDTPEDLARAQAWFAKGSR
jgi:3-deoxy-manno-octulosonate cytidylyltransferase (CMP-KDO synthetase)